MKVAVALGVLVALLALAAPAPPHRTCVTREEHPPGVPGYTLWVRDC